MPSSRDLDVGVRPFVATDGDPGLARVRVLRDVREGLRDDEVGGGLDWAGEPARLSSTLTVTGTGARRASVRTASARPLSVERGGVDPACASSRSSRSACWSSCSLSIEQLLDADWVDVAARTPRQKLRRMHPPPAVGARVRIAWCAEQLEVRNLRLATKTTASCRATRRCRSPTGRWRRRRTTAAPG